VDKESQVRQKLLEHSATPNTTGSGWLQLPTAIAAFFFKHGIEYDEHYLWD